MPINFSLCIRTYSKVGLLSLYMEPSPATRSFNFMLILFSISSAVFTFSLGPFLVNFQSLNFSACLMKAVSCALVAPWAIKRATTDLSYCALIICSTIFFSNSISSYSFFCSSSSSSSRSTDSVVLFLCLFELLCHLSEYDFDDFKLSDT